MNKARELGLLLILLILSAPGSYSQQNPVEKFQQGVSLYISGNYQDAIDVWNELYNNGYRSAELNYNLGNAYFKIQKIPESILFYERAYLLDPLNEDINYNLQIARTLTVDRFQEIPELFFIRWYNLVSLFLTSDSWAIISLASFIICLLSVSLYIYSSKYLYKVAGFWVGLVLLLISVMSVSFSIRNKKQVYNSQKAIISNPVVSGKSSPDISGTDLFVLHEGTKVSVEDEVGEWYEIRLSDGNKGWVTVKSLIII